MISSRFVRSRKILLGLAASAMLTLNSCFLEGLGWKYLPYVYELPNGNWYFDENSYDHDHDDDDCEWYKWPIDCY